LNSRWPPKIVFGLESTNMHIVQNAFFYFFSVLQFYGKTLFLNPKWRLVSRWRFCHFKFTLFSKNGFTKYIYSKKIINGLQAKKFNMALKIKMVAYLEFFTPTAWCMLEFIVLILYFMRLHSLKYET
jgi:hypothetical protein